MCGLVVEMLVGWPERPETWVVREEVPPEEAESANEPPCSKDPRTERMMRSVIEVVRTAAMLMKN